MKRTILFPTDFSDNAHIALDYAVAFADSLDAEILVFHAYSIALINTDMPYSVIEEELERVKHKAIEDLEALCKTIKEKNPEVSASYILKQGFAGSMIVEFAKDRDVDMIIMGTQGAGAVKSFFIGSNAADVIENASCPVLAVPERVPYKGIKTIAFASDYYDSDIKDLSKLTIIAKALDAEITIINISDEGKEIQEAVSARFMREVRERNSYPRIELKLIESDDVEKSLEKYMKENPTDLLVTSTRKRNLLEKFMERSLTKQLAYHAKVPLLAFHQK
ncbi:universal stress protein [Cytophagaceae bacterium ABcell3]|nr:universal stress protein [Cytophagaceae bacterium ABcell3]